MRHQIVLTTIIMIIIIYFFKGALLSKCGAGRGFSGTEGRKEASAHPFAALPGVCQHLLQGANRQRLLQHKVADAQVRRDILQGGRRKRRVRHEQWPETRETCWWTLKKKKKKKAMNLIANSHKSPWRSHKWEILNNPTDRKRTLKSTRD